MQFARAFIFRYQAAIFRCKKIGEMGAQQMLLDAQGLRAILLAAPAAKGRSERASSVGDDDDELRALAGGTFGPCVGGVNPLHNSLLGASYMCVCAAVGADSSADSAAPAIYIKTVTKELPRVEMLFKIIAAPRERFPDTCVTATHCTPSTRARATTPSFATAGSKHCGRKPLRRTWFVSWS